MGSLSYPYAAQGAKRCPPRNIGATATTPFTQVVVDAMVAPGQVHATVAAVKEHATVAVGIDKLLVRLIDAKVAGELDKLRVLLAHAMVAEELDKLRVRGGDANVAGALDKLLVHLVPLSAVGYQVLRNPHPALHRKPTRGRPGPSDPHWCLAHKPCNCHKPCGDKPRESRSSSRIVLHQRAPGRRIAGAATAQTCRRSGGAADGPGFAASPTRTP